MDSNDDADDFVMIIALVKMKVIMLKLIRIVNRKIILKVTMVLKRNIMMILFEF